jgi:hypothetical protein
MTNYADYAYYTGTYKGAVIDAASFPLYARKATQEIKKYTFNRIQDGNIPDEVKMCCCELAEYFYRQENKDHEDDVQSEKKGEWSTTYVSGKEAEELKQSKIREIIYNWLAMSGLLYRGCY